MNFEKLIMDIMLMTVKMNILRSKTIGKMKRWYLNTYN